MKTITLNDDGLANESGNITVYHYDLQTGEYIGSSEEFLMQGIGIPDHSTFLPPPPVEKGMVAIYRDGSWHILVDHRGEIVYSTINGSEIYIFDIGDYPKDTTLLKPATKYDTWDAQKWITDANAQKAASIKEAELKKEVLIKEANEKTQAWQTQLLLGIISDEDKNSLITWMKYVQAVQAVDPQTAPSITWPVKPA